MTFEIHPQLRADCFHLGELNNCTLLLHKNALVHWFILVPHSHQTEIFKLATDQQNTLQQTINRIASFVDTRFKTDKLNIATIGNIVPQLHVHIIGRQIHDFCWPNPVWGQTESAEYSAAQVTDIQQLLIKDGLL